MVQQYIQNCDYLRPSEWVFGTPWAVNKITIGTNRTLLSDHLLAPFKLFARIDDPFEDDLCRMTLAAAIDSVEHYTRLTINPTERMWALRGVPTGAVMQIPYQPVQTLLVRDLTGTDITSGCEVNSNTDDIMFYLRLPQGVEDADVVFGSGFYADPASADTVWSTLNLWNWLNVWTLPSAVIDDNPLYRQAILITAADFYENRQSDTAQMRTNIPSIAEMVLRPIRRPLEF
jgi:hypothetical protein